MIKGRRDGPWREEAKGGEERPRVRRRDGGRGGETEDEEER